MWVAVRSTLPSVVVVKAFVAKMLTTWQVIPARCVSIFSTPKEEKSGPSKQSVSDKRVSYDLVPITRRDVLPFRCACETNWVCGRASSLLTLSVLFLGLVVLLLCVCGFSLALQEKSEENDATEFIFIKLNQYQVSSKMFGRMCCLSYRFFLCYSDGLLCIVSFYVVYLMFCVFFYLPTPQ